MINEPNMKLRVVVSDTALGDSIESSSLGIDDDISFSYEPTTLTLVTADGGDSLGYTKRPPASDVMALLGKIKPLLFCPPIVLRLASMIGDPTVTPTDIEKIIKKDSAVANQVIALANTNYFSLARQLYYVREVLVFLGYMHVRNLGMLASVQNLMQGRDAAKSTLRDELWHHSLDVAYLSRKISEHMGLMERTSVGGEQAFTVGLLHDIGKLGFDLIMHAELVEANNEALHLGVPFYEVEHNHLPFSHCVLGEAIAMQWNLPAVVADSIAFHHEPGNAQLHPELAATVCLADQLAHSITIDGESVGVPLDIFDTLDPAACAVLGLQRRELQTLVDVCSAEMLKIQAIHSL